MTNERLIIGMPAGSLADPNRGGNLMQLLEASGFRTRGYDAGGPTSFPAITFLYGWDGRPQEFGSQLGIGEIDVAIGGDDWIKERLLELEIEYGVKVTLQKVLSLKRGGVRIVGIVKAEEASESTADYLRHVLKQKSLITVVAEMPYLALDWMRREVVSLGRQDLADSWAVQKYKTPPRIEKGILIYETWGKTESKVKNGGADLGLEITQSGSAIRNYGLKILTTVLESESGIWIDPKIRTDKGKSALLDMFLLNLYGTLNAEGKVLVVFNVPNPLTEKVEEFLRVNSLYADEPTRTVGKDFTVYSIQVDTDNPRFPLARVRYELAALGARSIDTMPLSSSIPGISVLR